ncbi:MAG TPA: ABC transporter permease subunit [Sphaerochaeta sp.]|nr:ABC transporter permease subunit [Sphaerochaeta sp.]
MNSTSSANHKKGTIRVWSVLLWLGIWQLVAMALGQDILLVTPINVIARLFVLVRTGLFWRSIGYSFSRIAGGFFLATLIGVLFAFFSYRYRWFEEFLAPPMQTIKATPVASFVILTLVWIAPKNLSVFISFLMVLPIMYTNVLMGIRSTDKKLLEMATVFRVPTYRRIRYIYLSQALPFFRSACSVALGLSWKAGIAAEVIGLPQGSIGEMLYQAKIYLDTPDMFAWTLVIIIISVWFEKIFLILIDRIMLKMEHL